MHRALPTHAADYFGPVVGGFVFVLLMSLLKPPTRRNFNAIFVGGAMGAYVSGGLGLWELAFAAAGSLVAFRGLRDVRLIGVAWLMHSAWDLVHHFFANPIWPFMEMSSFGCSICDAVISAWFFVGAPSLVQLLRIRGRAPEAVVSKSGQP
jgi:hypothetical protein